MAAASSLEIPSSAIVLILADGNFGDPKPYSVSDCLKFKPEEIFTQRVTSLPSLQAVQDSGAVARESLRYLIVACLSPMIAGAATATADGDRADNVGKYWFICVNIPR